MGEILGFDPEFDGESCLLATMFGGDEEEDDWDAPIGGHNSYNEENDTRNKHEKGNTRRSTDQGRENKELNGRYTPTRPPSKRQQWRNS